MVGVDKVGTQYEYAKALEDDIDLDKNLIS